MLTINADLPPNVYLMPHGKVKRRRHIKRGEWGEPFRYCAKVTYEGQSYYLGGFHEIPLAAAAVKKFKREHNIRDTFKQDVASVLKAFPILKR
jgi:hypothetical protein